MVSTRIDDFREYVAAPVVYIWRRGGESGSTVQWLAMIEVTVPGGTGVLRLGAPAVTCPAGASVYQTHTAAHAHCSSPAVFQ